LNFHTLYINAYILAKNVTSSQKAIADMALLKRVKTTLVSK